MKTREDARLKLMEVKRQIQEKSAEMLGADPKLVPKLTQELQRLRVSMLMLREIVEDVADPNAYRELKLLNGMMEDLDLDEDRRLREQAEGEAAARARIEDFGITPENAGNMVRALSSLSSLMSKKAPDGTDPDDRPVS